MINYIHQIFKLNNITKRVFFWIVFLVFISSVLFLLSYVTIDKKYRISKAKQELEYALINQKLILENWKSERAAEIRYLANLPVSKAIELEAMVDAFQNFTNFHDELHSIVFLDENGFVTIDSAHDEAILQSKVSLANREYFIAAQQGEESMYDVVVSKSTGKPAIIFSVPLLSEDNEFQGVLFGAIHLSKLNEILCQSILGESGKIMLLNREGMILSHLSNDQSTTVEHNLLTSTLHTVIAEKMWTGEVVPTSYVDAQGNEVYGSYASLFNDQFFLVNEISKKEVLQPHYQMIKVLLWITIMIMLIGFLLITPVSKHLIRPFVLLVEAIKEIKAGNYRTQLDPNSFQTAPLELRQIMGVFNEMSATIHANKQKLKQLSRIDGLTGIANRRTFDEYYENEWQMARKKQKPLSLIFLDIDSFKHFNDTFGHLAGDQCLIKVAQALRDYIKGPKELVARYGGEEFIIILPGKTSKEATLVAESVRHQIELLKIPRLKHRQDKFVTVSIGVATVIPSHSMKKEDLIQLADQALYEAKSGGRNQVVTKG